MQSVSDVLVFIALLSVLSLAVAGPLCIGALLALCRQHGLSPLWGLAGAVPLVGLPVFFLRLGTAAPARALGRASR